MSLLDQFLSDITSSLRSKNGSRIAELIHLDVERLPPERQQPYLQLNQQLRSQFPAHLDGRLLERCKIAVPQDEFGSFSASFSESIARYFRYLRDVETADNLSKALEVRQLTSQCVTALGDTRYGAIMIPIVLSFSRTLAFIATYLDRNPSILKQAQSNLPSDTDLEPSSTATSNDGGKVSFLEDTANVLRDAFIKCLAGSPGVQRTSPPSPTGSDKRIGIYLTANATLKLLFQARKLRNAQQMFLSIDAQSPPLSFYPAAQRVTYLYYLGRYHFANNHFLRAASVLDAAYQGCHKHARTQRRLILTYLIAANICVGNLPTSKLLLRPEASTLGRRFMPLINIIKCGDIGSFESLLDLRYPSAQWFLQRRILLQLRNRGEVLIWRSLIRKCFILQGYKGEERKTPFLRLGVVRSAARFSITHAKILQAAGSNNGFPPPAADDASYIDPEFRDITSAQEETGFDIISGTYTYTSTTSEDPSNPGAHTQTQRQDLFPPPSSLPEPQQSPTLAEVESIFLSLIHQGFLRGFISRPAVAARNAAGTATSAGQDTGNYEGGSAVGTVGVGSTPLTARFAIRGSKTGGGPVGAGFPDIYGVITANSAEGGGVPGWVRQDAGGMGGTGAVGMAAGVGGGAAGGGSMAGRVVNLSGARPVGMN